MNSLKDINKKMIYSLTEKEVDLVPIVIEIGLWTDSYTDDIPAQRKDLILKDVRVDKQKAIEQLKEDLYDKHIQRALSAVTD